MRFPFFLLHVLHGVLTIALLVFVGYQADRTTKIGEQIALRTHQAAAIEITKPFIYHRRLPPQEVWLPKSTAEPVFLEDNYCKFGTQLIQQVVPRQGSQEIISLQAPLGASIENPMTCRFAMGGYNRVHVGDAPNTHVWGDAKLLMPKSSTIGVFELWIQTANKAEIRIDTEGKVLREAQQANPGKTVCLSANKLHILPPGDPSIEVSKEMNRVGPGGPCLRERNS